jgi:hypothetical protein
MLYAPKWGQQERESERERYVDVSATECRAKSENRDSHKIL